MKLRFPSVSFDDTVAALCHDAASDEQVRELHELLRNDAAARDEYLLRLELHSRLASEPDLFASARVDVSTLAGLEPLRSQNARLSRQSRARAASLVWKIGLAACLLLLVGVATWRSRTMRAVEQNLPTSKAVAMLNRTVDAQWHQSDSMPRLNAPLEPGRLRLKAGLAQVVFYSGVRIVIEGPAELQLISESEAVCRTGRMVLEVPAQARGFCVRTPHVTLTDLGNSVGVDVKEGRTELHTFHGTLKLRVGTGATEQTLPERKGALIRSDHGLESIEASPSTFASLFDLQARSEAAEARRYHQWRTACKRLERDASLLVRFDFEHVTPAGWQIRNSGNPSAGVADATIVGCQLTEGRWPEKRALEFQSVSDRVRLMVPGEFHSLTLSAWVGVKGLDRKINSLFMCDGFEPGTIHWLIRRDGVLGLTVIGKDRRHHQIAASPPRVTLEKFGTWLHLAVVLDAGAERISHYLNGLPVSEEGLKIAPPFRLGPAELGNWNAKGFPENDPFMIRNFSGAIDEFCLFNRALDAQEIRTLYIQGKPQGDAAARP